MWSFFRKKKKAREEELKKNEGAILKFENISLQFSLFSANKRVTNERASANLYLTRKRKRQLNLSKVIKK